MDESGHDHRQMPYEVRGGFALRDDRLWAFVCDLMALELNCFGARLSDYKSEIKGSKLLSVDRFAQIERNKDTIIEKSQRQQLCRSFLQAGLEKKGPKGQQLTAYAQACIEMADGIFELLWRYDAKIFASAVPKGAAKRPKGEGEDRLRKDHIFLFERFFYFLEEHRQMGIIVMDEVEETADKKFVGKLHDYFTNTMKGKNRTHWIVPAPFFVSSDMALPVQVADVIIYCINWGFRYPEMTAPYREEIYKRYGPKIHRLRWVGDGYDGENVFRSFGIFCVPDLFVPRK